MTIQNLRELTSDELSEQLQSTHKDLFDLRFKKALRQLDNPAKIRTLRHRVSQIKTVMHEKAIATSGGTQ